jgi:hypothetical protein
MSLNSLIYLLQFLYFRSSLDSAEQDIEHLEAKLERVR